jgi:predicted metal-binding transcription factor (methanogenesis marker protein 9)
MCAVRRIMKVEDIPETPIVITAREFARQMMESYEEGKNDCLNSIIEVCMMAQPSPERDRFVAVMHRLLQETKADG